MIDLAIALEVHRPVERRVAAADEQDALALELLRIEHLEVEALLLEAILALDAEPPRLERADAGRDEDGPGRDSRPSAVSSTKCPARRRPRPAGGR